MIIEKAKPSFLLAVQPDRPEPDILQQGDGVTLLIEQGELRLQRVGQLMQQCCRRKHRCAVLAAEIQPANLHRDKSGVNLLMQVILQDLEG